MSSQNPYEPGPTAPQDAEDSPTERVSAERAAYNVVSDTFTGVNVRKSDNRFQAIFILISVLVLAAVGSIATPLSTDGEIPWYGGAIFGVIAGLVIGLFASGIFLMFYRAARHLKGKHD